LEADEWIFQGDASVDRQYQVYREMREIVKHDWRPFYPRTNILWLQHIVSCMTQKLPKKAKMRQSLEDLSVRLSTYPDMRSLLKTDEFFGRKNK
jgi:serine/threonine-protein kinase haspin